MRRAERGEQDGESGQDAAERRRARARDRKSKMPSPAKRATPPKPSGGKTVDAGRPSAAKQGSQGTRERSKGLPARVGKGFLAVAGPLFAIFFDVLGFVLNLAISIAGRLVAGLAWLLGRARRLTAAASRVVTPSRALVLVVAGASLLLALSQFADYRGVSIGTDAYSGELQTVAPAPERERSETGSAHGYAMVPLAIACLALLAFAVLGRRPMLCRLIALAGVVAIAVGLIVDRPAGQDPGELEIAYQGVEATLLGGFYAQIFAGFLLAASALLLSRELQSAAEREPAGSRRRGEEPRSSRRKASRSRRAPKPEGAGA